MSGTSRLHICVPNYRGWIEAPHHISMIQLTHYLGTRHQDVNFLTPSHSIVSTARQLCVNAALQDPLMDRVLFIDDDMVFGPEHFQMLENEFRDKDLDFLGALAFANSIPTKPCVFGRNPDMPEWGDQQWWFITTQWPEAQRFEVYCTGFGMCMISRRLLEKLRETTDHGQMFRFPHPLCPNEDISFCLNAHKAGAQLYVDSRVSIEHISKDRPLIGEEVYKAQGDAMEYSMGVKPLRLRPVGGVVEPVAQVGITKEMGIQPSPPHMSICCQPGNFAHDELTDGMVCRTCGWQQRPRGKYVAGQTEPVEVGA